MKNLKTRPIIIGAAQYTQLKETKNPLDRLRLVAKVSKLAIEDTGAIKFQYHNASLLNITIAP
jgi:hypothetical protein